MGDDVRGLVFVAVVCGALIFLVFILLAFLQASINGGWG